MRTPIAPVILLGIVLNACTTMKPVESPVTFLEQNNPRHVRVFTPDGELYVLREPQLRGDTIMGFEPLERENVKLSLNTVRRMEALQPDKKRTTLFIGAMTVLAGAGIYMITQVAGGGDPLICDNYDVANRCTTKPTGAPSIVIPLKF